MAVIPISQSARRRTDYEVFRRAHPAFVARIQWLRKHRDRELAKLSRLTGVAKRNRVRSLLADRSLHLLYAYEGTLKAKRLRDATPDTIMELASGCNPFRACHEPGTVRTVTKRGKARLVSAFGPAKRMHQLLVADLLRHLHPPLDQQYLFRGGMPAALRAVEAAYREGFTYAVEIDIVDFYGSVRLEGLADIMRPLPETVVRHVVWDEAFMTCMGQDDDVPVSVEDRGPSSSAQRGLVLGSACSPIAGELILAGLLAHSDRHRVVAYADNILVLGRSMRGCRQYVEQMRERASSFVGCALEQRVGPIRDLRTQSFTFLRQEGHVDNETFVWSPDYRRLTEFLIAEAGRLLTPEMIEQAENRISNWRRAYPLWPDGDEWEARQLAALAARRFYLEASPLNRANAAQSLASAYLMLGRLVSLEELAPEGTQAQDLPRRAQLIEAAESRLVLMAQRSDWDREQIRFRG